MFFKYSRTLILFFVVFFAVLNYKKYFIFSRYGKLHVFDAFIQHCFICRTSDQLSLDDTGMIDFRFLGRGSTFTDLTDQCCQLADRSAAYVKKGRIKSGAAGQICG